MTKLYVLGTHIVPPSPWTNETGFSNRHVRTCETPGDTGTVVISSPHSHSVASSTVGSSGYWGEGECESGPSGRAIEHDNHALAATFSSEALTPPYYGMALWSVDLAIWEAALRKFPTGAILLSDSQISDAELTRVSDADGRLIRIGTPGAIGGSSTHTHTVDGSLSYIDPYVETLDGDGDYYVNRYPHSHTISGATGASTLLPARVQTRLYRAISATTRAAAGVICFVDGTPSSNWEAVAWGQRCIESANSNATLTGVDTHNHSFAGTSSSVFSGSERRLNWWGWGYRRMPPTHSHSFSLTASIESHVPSHVKLYPVKLKITLQLAGKATNLCGC
jgi:hypothetical protein